MSDERLLIVMPNWFGETLFATPFLSALRRARPRAVIAAMGVPRCQDVLAHNPTLNEFVRYEEEGAHRSLAAKWRLACLLRARRFETAVILRRSLSRALLLAMAGIPRRIGFDHWKSRWVLTDRIAPPGASTHKAASYLRLLEPLGITQREAPAYAYYPSDEERNEAAALLREAGLEGRPFIVLHPGANWAHKQWPAERFAQLGERFARAGTHVVVLTGSPEDAGLIRAIRQHMPTQAVVLAGRTSLRQLAACLARAGLVVSNDTGVLHIACALTRPVVALYGPTSPAITGPLSDPASTVVIHHADCCPRIPCLDPRHPGSPGMASITVEEVYAAARKLLNQTSDRSQTSEIRP